MSRWDPFTPEELDMLLDGVLFDDGIDYEPQEYDEPVRYRLVAEMRARLARAIVEKAERLAGEDTA